MAGLESESAARTPCEPDRVAKAKQRIAAIARNERHHATGFIVLPSFGSGLVTVSHPLIEQIDHRLGPERPAFGHPRCKSSGKEVANPHSIGMVICGIGHIRVVVQKYGVESHAININRAEHRTNLSRK